MNRGPWSFLIRALAVPMAATRVAGEVLWQIGTFDDSSAELRQWIHPGTGARQFDYRTVEKAPRFVVGRSRPEDEWWAYQPGSANGEAGGREHPATVEFVVARAPSRPLRLRVGLLSYSARLPVVQVELNGHRGWFHQRPRLAYSAGDPAVFFQPHYSTNTVTCLLRPDWIRTGTNHLVLTAVDVPGEREDVRPSGFPWPGCSGLVYDALSLETVEEPTGQDDAAGLEAEVEPTVFFHDHQGRLEEEVNIHLRFRGHRPAGRVTLELGDFKEERAFETSRDFGDEQLTFMVPAWEGARDGMLSVAWEGGVSRFPCRPAAARRWEIWVVPHEHLDVGYTDDPARVAELQSRVLDDALALTRRHPAFRYTPDGFWVVEAFFAGRTEAARQALVEGCREGRILIPAVHASIFTGSATLEGLVRSLYPSHAFARAHGTPFDVALVTDVPSCSWSFASVLAAAGIRYFVTASDAYRGPFLLRNRLHERSPYLWEGPDGGQVVTWQSRHYHQVSSLFGLPPRIALGRESLPRFLQAYDHPGYRGSGVILFGTQVENSALQPAQATFVDAWNAAHAYPRLQYGGFASAMADIVRQQGDLSRVRGDGGPYWEDGLAANARVTSLARENGRRILSAEKAASLASLVNRRFAPDASDLAAAWHHSRLVDEHTWHADCSVRDPESDHARRQGEAKDAHATDAQRSLERVLQRSMSALADVIAAGPGTVVLFNPLSWPRRDEIEFETGRGQGLVDPATGDPIPFEVLQAGRVYQRVRLMTPEVPALGYRCLQLRPLAVPPRPRASETPNLLESPHFRVVLEPERGAILSLVDKRSGVELASTNSPYGLGQLLYVEGGDDLPNRLVQYSTVSPVPKLTVHGATGGILRTSILTATGARAILVSHAPNFPEVETEIELPISRAEVRLTLRVRKKATLSKEAVYVAFPFALGESRFRYATQNGYVDPARDLLPGGCQEWFTVQDWLAIEGPSCAVMVAPRDAPLVTLGDIVRGTWPDAFGTRPATVFSYLMSNYTPEGYAASQGGAFTFRYVLTSGPRFDPALAARFGAEAMTPIEVNEITRSDKVGEPTGELDPVQRSGLRLEPPEVHVVTWKPAEDGRGTIVRLLETAGKATTVTLALHGGALKGARLCNVVEDDDRDLEVKDGETKLPIGGFGIASVRLDTTEAGSR